MKFKEALPIKFTDEMVRAILAGTKTQTRRPVKQSSIVEHPAIPGAFVVTIGKMQWWLNCQKDHPYHILNGCPFGKVGDRVWVKEAYSFDENLEPIYRADGVSLEKGISWNSLSTMPQRASRITLEITEIQVEKVQEITEDDAMAEGMEIKCDSTGRTRFRNGWDKIYKEKGFGWDANPWVWVISFRRVKP